MNDVMVRAAALREGIPVHVAMRFEEHRALAALPGITYLSVGHRPSLLHFHSTRLRLFGMDAQPSYVVEVIDDALVSENNGLEANVNA